MGVGDYDCFQAAEGVDLGSLVGGFVDVGMDETDFVDGFLVEEGDEVPEDVAVLTTVVSQVSLDAMRTYCLRSVRMSSARLPMANLGSVLTHQMSGWFSTCHHTFLKPCAFNLPKVVKTCPVGGTYL